MVLDLPPPIMIIMSVSFSTQYVYASLITGHAQNGNMEQAEGVLELSKTKGYSPGSVAYSALLCAYAQQGDFDGMLKVELQCLSCSMFVDLLMCMYYIEKNQVPVIGYPYAAILETV